MGAWNAGSFDNDDAQDWALEFVKGSDTDFIIEALERIIDNDEYIEASECQQAIAAAEVVAAMKGHFAEDLPEEVASWVTEHGERPALRLVHLAQQAVERIKHDSELQELWEESDSAAWYESLDDLQNRLGQ